MVTRHSEYGNSGTDALGREIASTFSKPLPPADVERLLERDPRW